MDLSLHMIVELNFLIIIRRHKALLSEDKFNCHKSFLFRQKGRETFYNYFIVEIYKFYSYHVPNY